MSNNHCIRTHLQPEIPQVTEIYRWYDQGVSLIGMMEIHSDKIVERSIDFSQFALGPHSLPGLHLTIPKTSLKYVTRFSLYNWAKKIILKFLYNRR